MTRTALALGTFVLASVGLVATDSRAQASQATITLKAPDGLTLKATYYSPGKPGPGLVLLHQCNRDRTAWAAFGEAAAARGYHVIALDFRGHGESGGQRLATFEEQAPVIAQKWPGDLDAAYAWLTGQQGVDKDRIGAAGASCGVNESVLLARRHPQIRTVMLLSGTVNQAGRQYLRDTPSVSVLAVGSEDDGSVLDNMRWILGWSRNPANRLVEYRAAGHGTEMFSVEKGLQPLMLEWLDARLKNASLASTTVPDNSPPSPVEVFWTTLAQPNGAVKARQLYDAARKQGDRIVFFPEGEMNAHGYELLRNGRAEEAIVVFEMNVDGYPDSANTYDSLSDAYLAAAKREEALRFAEKTLQVLAKDTRTPEAFKAAIRESAERKINELKKK